MTEFSFIDKRSFNWCLLATDNLTPSFWTVNHHKVIWRTRWPKCEKHAPIYLWDKLLRLPPSTAV